MYIIKYEHILLGRTIFRPVFLGLPYHVISCKHLLREHSYWEWPRCKVIKILETMVAFISSSDLFWKSVINIYIYWNKCAQTLHKVSLLYIIVTYRYTKVLKTIFVCHQTTLFLYKLSLYRLQIERLQNSNSAPIILELF